MQFFINAQNYLTEGYEFFTELRVLNFVISQNYTKHSFTFLE